MLLNKIRFAVKFDKRGKVISSNKDAIIPDLGTIILAGKTKAGKSTIARDILYAKRRLYSYLYVISGSEGVNRDYCKHTPKRLIFSKFNEESIKKIFKEQSKAFRKYGQKIAMVFDDSTNDKKFLKNPWFLKLIQQGRQYGILLILCTQYLMSIPKETRKNAEFISFCTEKSIKSRKDLFNDYFGFFEHFRDFDDVFKKYTKKHQFVFINLQASGYEPKNCMYHYMSNSVVNDKYSRSFKIGSSELWHKARKVTGMRT
ncbi:MAG: hypothetical protein N2B06_16925 [Clostridium sp.]